MARAEQALLLAIPEGEYYATFWCLAHLFHSTRNLQHSRHTRGIVIGSIVATVAINRGTDAHMVVVCTHNHILITLAGDYSKYVVHFTIPNNKRLHVPATIERPYTPLAKQRNNIFGSHAAALLACTAALQGVGRKRFNKKTRIG